MGVKQGGVKQTSVKRGLCYLSLHDTATSPPFVPANKWIEKRSRLVAASNGVRHVLYLRLVTQSIVLHITVL